MRATAIGCSTDGRDVSIAARVDVEQTMTSVGSPTGQRYLNGSSTVLLFVRQEPRDEFGTSPYLFLGPAQYVSHEGDRPIAITWHLETPMPTDFFNLVSAIAQ